MYLNRVLKIKAQTRARMLLRQQEMIELMRSPKIVDAKLPLFALTVWSLLVHACPRSVPFQVPKQN